MNENNITTKAFWWIAAFVVGAGIWVVIYAIIKFVEHYL